jgi:hypothetical protein
MGGGAGNLNPPRLRDARNTRNNGVNFRSRKEEYVTLWFSTPVAELNRKDLRPEIGGFGTQALFLKNQGAGDWMLNIRVPPGLKPGRHPVRLRTAESRFSNECYIYVDFDTDVGAIEIRSLCDGISWRENVCVTATGRFATLYAGGVAQNSDANNLQVVIDGVPVSPTFIGSPDENESRQINFQCLRELPIGKYEISLRQAGRSSNIVVLEIIDESQAG